MKRTNRYHKVYLQTHTSPFMEVKWSTNLNCYVIQLCENEDLLLFLCELNTEKQKGRLTRNWWRSTCDDYGQKWMCSNFIHGCLCCVGPRMSLPFLSLYYFYAFFISSQLSSDPTLWSLQFSYMFNHLCDHCP